jgi:hypothetical protein
MVDRFTKMAHFFPLSTDTAIKGLDNLYLKEVCWLDSLSSTVVSDRDNQFKSKFWLLLIELSKVDIRLSTTFHPLTDGQKERVNQVLEQYLSSYYSYQQDDWIDLLPQAEHVYNFTVTESTKMSLFKPNYELSLWTNWP